MFVRNMENFLEKHIEGFFNQKFSSRLQAVEILKRLEKEMYFKKQNKHKFVYVPNFYTIYLSVDDYDFLYSDELCDELAAHIIAYANKNNYTIQGSLLVKCFSDKKLKKGCFCIEPEFNESEHETTVDEPVTGSTIIFDRPESIVQTPAISEQNQVKFARLTVIEGLDEGKTLDIGFSRINFGRRISNEFVLADKNSSRLHAYLQCEQYKHTLIDADSLNGTYVNEELIKQRVLSDGDEIRIGSTVILYEVK